MVAWFMWNLSLQLHRYNVLLYDYLLIRHATLAASHNDLKRHVEACADQIEIVRTELQNYTKTTMNEILTLNNDVSVTKQICERKKVETAELQLHIDSVLHMAAAKTLARSQVTSSALVFN